MEMLPSPRDATVSTSRPASGICAPKNTPADIHIIDKLNNQINAVRRAVPNTCWHPDLSAAVRLLPSAPL
jgi:hypothetical protein